MTTEIDSSLNQVAEGRLPVDFPLNLLNLAVIHFDHWSIEDLVREDSNIIACAMGISEKDAQQFIEALQGLAVGQIAS